MPFDADLADRLRRGLTPHDAREVAMFGGRSFMVNERLAMAASSDGSLLVRCAPGQLDELLTRPGVRAADMRGRPMSPGWVRVDIDAVADDDALKRWIDDAVAFALR